MSYEWKGDIVTALAVLSCGWSTAEEKIVYLAADEFVNNIAKDAYRQARRKSRCRTCGHDPFTGDGDGR